ncbi:MAG: YitT family protein [Firmicutes bacterium]|nr:YitT family protein [Bacillota bacterium]
MIVLGSAILAFGLYNVHSISGVTEGGVLGLTLLLEHWFGISPSISGLVLNGACYVLGLTLLGKEFILYSIIAGGGFSLFYAIFERFPPLWPQIAQMPLAASVAGAAFVGVGVGLCIRANAAPTGDDSLALSLSHHFKIGIQWVYLLGDLIVLALSLTYIPFSKIIYSLLTVVLSGQLIGLIQKAGKPKKPKTT